MRDLNFFEYEIKEKSAISKKGIIIIVSGVLLAVFLISSYSINRITIKSLNSEIKVLKNKISYKEVSEEIKKNIEVKKRYDETKKNIELLDNASKEILSNNVIGTQLISEIGATVPKNVHFTGIAISQESIEIQGKSSSRVAIAEFEHNIKTLSNLENIHISVISGDKDIYTFSLKCNIKGVKANESNK